MSAAPCRNSHSGFIDTVSYHMDHIKEATSTVSRIVPEAMPSKLLPSCFTEMNTAMNPDQGHSSVECFTEMDSRSPFSSINGSQMGCNAAMLTGVSNRHTYGLLDSPGNPEPIENCHLQQCNNLYHTHSSHTFTMTGRAVAYSG